MSTWPHRWSALQRTCVNCGVTRTPENEGLDCIGAAAIDHPVMSEKLTDALKVAEEVLGERERAVDAEFARIKTMKDIITAALLDAGRPETARMIRHMMGGPQNDEAFERIVNRSATQVVK